MYIFLLHIVICSSVLHPLNSHASYYHKWILPSLWYFLRIKRPHQSIGRVALKVTACPKHSPEPHNSAALVHAALFPPSENLIFTPSTHSSLICSLLLDFFYSLCPRTSPSCTVSQSAYSPYLHVILCTYTQCWQILIKFSILFLYTANLYRIGICTRICVIDTLLLLLYILGIFVSLIPFHSSNWRTLR
jgi:transposase